jgi:hypothetical protein
MKKLKDIISDIDESVWKILSNDFNLLTENLTKFYQSSFVRIIHH